MTTSVLIYSYKELYPHIITRAAYKIYETYNGSSRHYQAVLIIRSKVRGVADAALAYFNTPLYFEAIINRLDFTYCDKRPIHVIEQELGTR